MVDIPHLVKLERDKLIPAALDLACFVFYDNHPRHQKNIDITICTSDGEIRELFNKNVVSSLHLNCKSKPKEIKIVRNRNAELFYLIATRDELYIVSSKDELKLHQVLANVESYIINDKFSDQYILCHVKKKGDPIPIQFDDNFKLIQNMSSSGKVVSLPVVEDLKRKLTEAKYTVQCNEETYKQHVNLRQHITQSWLKLKPNSEGNIPTNIYNLSSNTLDLEVQEPIVKVCNKKFIIILKLEHTYAENIQNIHIFLHSAANPSLVYTTKLFSKRDVSPFWLEIPSSQEVKAKCEIAVVAVVDLEELISNITSTIALSVSISLQLLEQEYMYPFEDLVIPCCKLIGDEFDALATYEQTNDKETLVNIILAVLATTETTEIYLRHIKGDENEPAICFLDKLCTHLHMHKLSDAPNIIMYRTSPYHALNGTVIVFNNNTLSDVDVLVSIHTRTLSQVLALMQVIYNEVPYKIIFTLKERVHLQTNLKYNDYANSIIPLRRSIVLKYLDEQKSITNNVASDIDLFAGGVDSFKQFRDSLIDETRKCLDELMKEFADFAVNQNDNGDIDSDESLSSDKDVIIMD